MCNIIINTFYISLDNDVTHRKSIDNDVTHQKIFTLSKLLVIFYTLMCEVCSKLTIKTPERCQCRRSSVFIVNFGHISHLFLAFLLFTFNK